MKLSEAISLLSDAGVVSAAYDAKELFMHFGGFGPVQLIGADPECGSEELEAAVVKLYTDKEFYQRCKDGALKLSAEVNWETEFGRLIEFEREITNE